MAKDRNRSAAEETLVGEGNIEDVTEPTDRPTVEDKKPKAPTGPLMYVGPTIPRLGIQNAVYSEIPSGAGEFIAKEPEIRNLFIPISEYPKANLMLREGKGYIHSAFIAALRTKGGK